MTKKLLKLCLVIAMVLSQVQGLKIVDVKAASVYENIALNKVVSASSTHSSKTITHAVDGKANTKETWQINYNTGSDYNRGNGDLEEDFTIDLGGNAMIEQVDLTWTETVWAKSVKVEGSLDGINYFLIKEVNDNVIKEDKGKQSISFNFTKTRFVKLTFNDPNNKTYGYEFYEVEVFGAMLTNLALNKNVTSSSILSSKNMNHLVDGKIVDKETWQIDYNGTDYNRGQGNLQQFILIDLGQAYSINEIDLTWATTVWAKTIKVEGSLDGNEYFIIKEISDNVITADKERQDISFTDIDTCYVKLTFNDPNELIYGYELYEVEVYGSETIAPKVNVAALYEEIKNIPPTISEDGTSLILPTVDEEGYKVVLYGSSNENIIGKDGSIYPPLVDMNVNVSYKVVNESDPKDCAFSNYDDISVVVPGQYEVNEQDNEKPIVLPELREWKGNRDHLTINEASRIVIEDETLQDTAQMIQYYFKEMLDRDIEIVVGEAKAGDISFTLKTRTDLGEEGYYVEIDDKVNVEANAKKGLLYAGATLVQILSQDENHAQLPKGIMRDYPAYAVRSMMIDVGRYYIPLDYLEEITKYMAYYKMSEVHVHVNDNGGEQSYAFRLESKKFPQINSNLNPEHVYSQEAYKAYQKEVSKYGIKVITEIDTPAHSGFLKLYDSSLLLNASQMDLSKPGCMDFIKALFDEYLDGEDPVIQTDTFHIGVDEYSKEHSDLARQYCDELIKYVNAKGYNTRMWGAFGSSSGLGGSYDVSRDVVCNYWSPNFSDPKMMIEDGYAAINNNRTYLYEVPSSDLHRNKYSIAQAYDNWDVIDVPGVTLSHSTPMLHGAESAFWYDSEAVYSEFDSFEVLKGMALVIAEKAWMGSDDQKTSKEFEENLELLGDYAPGANPQRYVDTKTEEIVSYDFEETNENTVNDQSENNYDATLNNVSVENGALQLNGEGYMSLPFDAKGLGYTLSFDLYLKENPGNNTVLFNGKAADGTFYLNYDNTGKMAFVRKGYEFTFDYELEVNQWTKVTITCDDVNTTLYIDGILVSTAIAKSSKARRTTFVLPTEEIGRGIVGILDNFVLTNRAISYDEILGFDTNLITNVALNKPTQVSGLETDDGRFTSDLAVDGDTATRVSLEKKDDAWFIVDLEDTYWVEEIEVAFGELPNKYQLFISEDGDTWTMVHEDLACAGGTALNVSKLFSKGIKVRYVKYQQLEMFTASNGKNYSGNFNEIRVFGAKENAIQNILQAAKDICETTEANQENKAYLEQLSKSVELIENELTSVEEIKLACKQLQDEIKKFEENVYSKDNVDKESLYAFLMDKEASNGIYNAGLYNNYYKQAITLYINSDATQTEVNEYLAKVNDIIAYKNLALNGEIISYNGLNPGRINDGEKPERGNYWDSDANAADSSIVVKLTQPAKVNKIVVIPYYYRTDYYYNYEVLVSNDNVNWTSLATFMDKEGNYNVHGQVYALNPATPIEYVKIQGIGSNNNDKIHIVELEVYGIPYTKADKEALNALITSSENFVGDDYTVETWTSLEMALKEAKAINEKIDASQEEVDAALSSLDQAIKKLEQKPAVQETDKTVLKSILDLCEAKIVEANKYTEESITELQRLYDLGMMTYNEPTVSQEMVNSCVERLQEAIAALVENPLEPEIVAPEKVTNVKVVQDSYKDVTVTWDAVEGATSYDVYRKAYKEDSVFTLVKTLEETTLSVSGLMTGKEYSFYVVAKNEAGVSPDSDVVVIATQLEGKPTLAIEQVSKTKFTLSWSEIDGATRYIIYRKRGDDPWKKVLTLGAEDSSYTTSEMPKGEYSFIVKTGRYDSKDRVMTGSSNTVKGTSTYSKPAITLTAGTKQVKVSWSEIEGVKYYEVFRATSEDGKYTKLKTTTATSFIAKSLTSGKSYYFKVRGYKSYNNGKETTKVYTSYSAVKYIKAK